MSESLTANLFAALNFLVLERLDVGSFQIMGTIPDWLRSFCHRRFSSGMKVLIPDEEFPFLENFLIDAEAHWAENEKKPLKSGAWIDSDPSGQEYYFEASAVCMNEQKILLVEWLQEDYEEKRTIIQKARENQLHYQQILKENQKKDVLIHCIIHDIAGQLSGINCCFALLEMENLSQKGKERLEIGRKQSIKQEMLIREILNAFSAEVQSLESFTSVIKNAPDALAVAKEVIQVLSPTFAVNRVGLQLAPNIDAIADWRVVGDKSRLERVITNLAENAYRYSPPESTVTINLKQDREFIIITVDDEGSGVSPEVAKTMFQKFAQGTGKTGRAGLGLYFCRITIERWGGEIGYSALPEKGSRFWLRLPKPGK